MLKKDKNKKKLTITRQKTNKWYLYGVSSTVYEFLLKKKIFGQMVWHSKRSVFSALLKSCRNRVTCYRCSVNDYIFIYRRDARAFLIGLFIYYYHFFSFFFFLVQCKS